jgi:anti-sigma-K factor RskA
VAEHGAGSPGGESLDGEARVGAVELGLVRGRIAVDDLVVERQHLGTLRLAIDRVEVDLAPLGAVVVAREPRRMVRVRRRAPHDRGRRRARAARARPHVDGDASAGST